MTEMETSVICDKNDILLVKSFTENEDEKFTITFDCDYDESANIFKIMEKKLYLYIMMPAMVLSWIFGMILISNIGFDTLSTLWIKIKLILVILLTLYHFYLGKLLEDFRLNKNTKSSKFFRIINEVPTLLLILIVFIVIFKPL